MTTTTQVPKLKPETKGKILFMLSEGAEGRRCPYDVEECLSMLREARGWSDEQWNTVARRLRIKH